VRIEPISASNLPEHEEGNPFHLPGFSACLIVAVSAIQSSVFNVRPCSPRMGRSPSIRVKGRVPSSNFLPGESRNFRPA